MIISGHLPFSFYIFVFRRPPAVLHDAEQGDQAEGRGQVLEPVRVFGPGQLGGPAFHRTEVPEDQSHQGSHPHSMRFVSYKSCPLYCI